MPAHDQTRMQAQTNEDEEKQHAKPPPVHGSPAIRLYRHALESILGMLTLTDLSCALAVCRSWSAAVRSMKPIDAMVERDLRRSTREKPPPPLPPMARLVCSPLLRHLSAIHINACGWTPLDNESLCLLARHASSLAALWCMLTLTPDELLILPAKLTSLQLRIRDGPTHAEINGVLSTLAALPSLSRLHLSHCAFENENGVDFRILSACPSLTQLELESFNGCSPYFSNAQVDQIRSSLGHLQRFSVCYMSSNDLARFLQPPVAVRWRDIGQVQADERIGELLLQLQTLTKVDLYYCSLTSHVDFLAQLPHLTAVHLECHRVGGEWSPTADALLPSLVRCSGLEEVSLQCGFNSAHWSALFTKLTIKTLTIRRCALETLRCFAAGPITHTLESLRLESLAGVPPCEVAHLSSLRRLRTLHLAHPFSPPLDDATMLSLAPPTPLLPALTCLKYLPSGYESTVERTGPAHEWMQQRATQ